MVSQEYVEKQLKDLDYKINGWGRSEVKQLPHIILPDEQIYEVVNGIYEGGFALLLATDIRVLLVDKKLMGFLTVEDLRFDMINEIDYSHRLLGAYITIATGNKTLIFRSYNKERLRKLIGHVQHCMAEIKKKQSSHAEEQGQHLEKINQQLQAYLVAQYKQQQKLQEQLIQMQTGGRVTVPEPIRPPDELSNFLYARGLLERYRQESGKDLTDGESQSDQTEAIADEPQIYPWKEPEAAIHSNDSQLREIYADGMQEVFGKRPPESTPSLEVNPIKVAYSKLPLAWRNRKLGLPKPSLPVYRSQAAQRTHPEPAR